MTEWRHSAITATDRDVLARLLAAVPSTLLAAVAGEMFQLAQFPANLRWQDTAAVVDRIAAIPPGPAGVPPLLAFADRVAAELSGGVAAEVDRWVDAAADATGFERASIQPGIPPEGRRGRRKRSNLSKQEASSRNVSRQMLSMEKAGAVTGLSASALLEPKKAARISGGRLRTWGGVPLRNPAFTGREPVLLRLRQALEERSKSSILPCVLHGMGGVGKTQLAVEYAYRHADQYDIVWWIPAEQPSLVLTSLHQLGLRLGIPEAADLQQVASRVLEALAASSLRWLLIYDNASEPDIARLIPPRGGHVILTSRSQIWSEVWDPIRVDVFERAESIELVRKRNRTVTAQDADRLAGRLGDLPLAVDQAVSCQAATGISVPEYLAKLDRYLRDQPDTAAHRATIVAIIRFTLQRLRESAPAVARLLEMFAYLGAEPISGGLLRRGRDARVSPPLRRALRDRIVWDRTIRDLRRYGLAKVDPDQRIQVHKLFQAVLREELTGSAATRAKANVQRLLASANPGYPDDVHTWPIHAELGPHVGPAGLIDSELLDARRVVLDQVRHLDLTGDLEGAWRLGDDALEAWSKVEGVRGLGPTGELTLRVAHYLAITLRHLGFNDRARSLTESAFSRLRHSTEFGPDHEYTLDSAGELAPNLRVAGLYREALEVDQDNLARCRRLFGDDDKATLKARNNLAVNLRMLGDFAGAHAIDTEAVRTWQQLVSENDNRLLFAQANLARDLYGLGRYVDALEILNLILPPYRQQLGAHHPHVLLAERTLAITLRKTGRYDEALAVAAAHDRDSESRYGPLHEHALAAAMTHANALRASGDVAESHQRSAETVGRYLHAFGEHHPLALAAMANHAIVLRLWGDLAQARELDERTHDAMARVLGAEHRFTLCVASNLASDRALAGDLEEARRRSAGLLDTSRRIRGARHPYTLACAVNAAIDTIAVGGNNHGQAVLDEAVAALAEVLGADHPETVAARERRRADSDIEPAPT